MGTHFFAGKAPQGSSSNLNMLARAGSAGSYAAKGASIGAQKDIGAAQGINKAGASKPLKNSAAYPKGPKV